MLAVMNPTRPSFISSDKYITKIPPIQINLFHHFLFSNIHIKHIAKVQFKYIFSSR